jgi:hypothetical protein
MSIPSHITKDRLAATLQLQINQWTSVRQQARNTTDLATQMIMITESLLVELKRAEEPVAQQPAFTFGAKTSEALSKAYNNSTIDEDVDDKVVAAGQK